MIVRSKKPPARIKEPKLPPPCGRFVTAKHPNRIAALRMRAEVIKAPPIRQTMAGARPATPDEIAECLRFAGQDHDPIMAKIAAERLLEHLECSGFVLMADETLQS
jgi:hypothetical protein